MWLLYLKPDVRSFCGGMHEKEGCIIIKGTHTNMILTKGEQARIQEKVNEFLTFL